MMQSIARAAELSEVRLGCGPPSAGSTENRTKAHVLADMRRAVGLDPTAVPMGIPMQTVGGEESAQAPAPPPMPPPVPPPAPAWPQGTMTSRRTAAGCTCEDDSSSLELCSTCHSAWWCTGCFAAQCPCVMEDVRRLHAAADAHVGHAPIPVQPAPAAPAVQQATVPIAAHFGLPGFEARGGAEIAGSQIVADQRGDLATCHSVRLTDGGILRATCPTSGPAVTTDIPPPGSIYLGTDLADTRVWATMDGRIIATTRPARSIAELTQPPSPPGSWMSRRTVCFTALILLTHLLAIGVAVGWSAGRPSTGMGHITGLPDAPHDAGALALRALNLFSLPSALRMILWLVGAFGHSICTAAHAFGYIGTTACRLLATPLHQAIASLPAQRFATCQGCTLSLAAATLRAIAHIIWAYGVGPTLATLGYVTGGALGATACVAATCVTTWVAYSVLAATPGIIRTLALPRRLRRAWGRVSPLIPPGSPPPWDTSTVFTRRSDYIHRPNWEGRFAGARRTCYSHLVSAVSQWHLPWWLLVLALQWAVVALLDIGARLLDYRIAVRSYRETLPLLGGEAPMAASMAAMGRYMARWLQRSYAGARRHLSRTLRTLAHSLLVSSTYLLHYLLAHGVRGTTRGALGWLAAWLVIIMQPLSHAGRALPRLASASHSLLWLLRANAAHRCSTTLAQLGNAADWLLFASRLALALLALAWQHWTGPRALPIARLPRAARTTPRGKCRSRRSRHRRSHRSHRHAAKRPGRRAASPSPRSRRATARRRCHLAEWAMH